MKDYKTILEGVVNIIKTTEKSDIGFVNICSYIGENCPELKESDDEEVRKAMIDFFKHEREEGVTVLHYGVNIERMIAWLEKQGEHANFLSKIQVGDKVTRNEGGVLVNISQLNRVAKKRKKQDEQNLIMAKSPQLGEQKPTDKVEPKFKVKYAGSEYNVLEVKDIAGVTFYGIEDEPNHIDYVHPENCEIIDGYGIKKNGCSFPTKPIMFSEQTPTNKVKPMFKVGDWFVNNITKDIFLIKGIYDGYYELEDIKGNIIFPCLPPCEKESHIWSIKDAKDGDVLVTANDKRPFIYRGCLDLNYPNSPVAYCGIDIEGGFRISGGTCYHWWTDVEVHPATKNQRDVLIKAMADAEYTFDFEKKELREV